MTKQESPAIPPTLAEGDELSPLHLKLTLQMLVMEAAANRDFAPAHHDPEFARSSGARAPYANTTLIEMLLEMAVRRWAGASARIRMLEFRMLDFNCAGDELTVGGTVTASTTASGTRSVSIEIGIRTDLGPTVTGTTTVEMPGQGD